MSNRITENLLPGWLHRGAQAGVQPLDIEEGFALQQHDRVGTDGSAHAARTQCCLARRPLGPRQRRLDHEPRPAYRTLPHRRQDRAAAPGFRTAAATDAAAVARSAPPGRRRQSPAPASSDSGDHGSAAGSASSRPTMMAANGRNTGQDRKRAGKRQIELRMTHQLEQLGPVGEQHRLAQHGLLDPIDDDQADRQGGNRQAGGDRTRGENQEGEPAHQGRRRRRGATRARGRCGRRRRGGGPARRSARAPGRIAIEKSGQGALPPTPPTKGPRPLETMTHNGPKRRALDIRGTVTGGAAHRDCQGSALTGSRAAPWPSCRGRI